MKKLPLRFDFETAPILKKLISAHKELAHLNGICESLPNQAVLVHTLVLQEAKDSSEIENIITTHADIYTAGTSWSLISYGKKISRCTNRRQIVGKKYAREEIVSMSMSV